ncbi:MAG TPA: PQQ-dependent sugar dehydrogenase, partial [Thermoanaerobaculia bacterium]|nr:PQQ-dependent sugar dehydrogenase [Thermoanaerobaculia bacterium]
MYTTRISVLCLALLGFSTLAWSDVFTVVGDISDIALQPQPGASGLAFPTSVVHAEDNRLFLTLRDGRIVIYSGGAVLPAPFLDIRSLVDTAGEGGLLSAAFHPNFAQNGFFFVNYTDKASFDTIVARYQVSAGNPNQADPASARVLLRIDQPFSNHNGGQIQFGPDGNLYIGMGDGGAANDPDCRAQRGDTLLGKMLRIDVDQNVNSAPFYGIPADNPFRGTGGSGDMPDEVWASGFRNPWRFSFDRSTGDLYIGDVGQGTREEISRQPANSNGGENYGWKVMEGTLCFSTASCPGTTPPCNSPALTLPILEYQNAGANCSVIGGYVYRGTGVPQLAGHYVFGDLCSGQIWAAKTNGAGTWQVWRAAEVGQNLIAFGEDRLGELYVATSSTLYKFASTAGPEEPEGADSVGLFDPATMTFSIKTSLAPGPADVTFRFGKRRKGWLPVAGDWNGDGRGTVGLWDRRSLSFHLKNSLSGGADDQRPFIRKVKAGWLPLAGDWNGDGRDGIGFYDPATGTFRFKNDPTTGRLMNLTVRIAQWQRGMIPL